jgi:Flp pilus assembly protein TadD
VELEPSLALAWNGLGIAHRDRGDLQRSVEYFQRALTLVPDDAETNNNLGATLTKLDRHDEAEGPLRRAISRRPDYASAHSNLGIVLLHQNRIAEAEQALQISLRTEPEFVNARSNLGALYLQQGRVDDAIRLLEDSIRIEPNHVDAHWNRSIAWLSLKRWQEGWLEYEWRRLKPEYRKRRIPRPMWDGTALGERTLLLHTEQGLGDTIQFIRYARHVKTLHPDCRILLACQKPLVQLLSRCRYLDEVIPQKPQLPAFDLHAPVMSLPVILGCDDPGQLADRHAPYLNVDPESVTRWQRQLEQVPGLKIGIAWQGNPAFRADATRSIALHEYARLSQVPEIKLVCLQKDLSTQPIVEIETVERVGMLRGVKVDAGFGKTMTLYICDDLDEQSGAFGDTAAMMKCVDAVVTSDTAIPHLAGALGVQTHLALSRVPDWRWWGDDHVTRGTIA